MSNNLKSEEKKAGQILLTPEDYQDFEDASLKITIECHHLDQCIQAMQPNLLNPYESYLLDIHYKDEMILSDIDQLISHLSIQDANIVGLLGLSKQTLTSNLKITILAK